MNDCTLQLGIVTHSCHNDNSYLFFCLFCRRIKVADFDFNKKCKEIAEQTEGLSGREIAKLGIAWQVMYTLIELKISV